MHNKTVLKVWGLLSIFMLVLGGCSAGQNLLVRNKPVIDLSKYTSPPYCPRLELRDGTGSLSLYEKGFEGDPAHLIHQARIVRTARECKIQDGQLVMRIGVNGRVLTGPSGGPATLSVPVRIVVIKFQDSVLYSQLHPVSVQISEVDPTPEFISVAEVSVPDPGEERNYLVYIGIDPEGAQS